MDAHTIRDDTRCTAALLNDYANYARRNATDAQARFVAFCIERLRNAMSTSLKATHALGIASAIEANASRASAAAAAPTDSASVRGESSAPSAAAAAVAGSDGGGGGVCGDVDDDKEANVFDALRLDYSGLYDARAVMAVTLDAILCMTLSKRASASMRKYCALVCTLDERAMHRAGRALFGDSVARLPTELLPVRVFDKRHLALDAVTASMLMSASGGDATTSPQSTDARLRHDPRLLEMVRPIMLFEVFNEANSVNFGGGGGGGGTALTNKKRKKEKAARRVLCEQLDEHEILAEMSRSGGGDYSMSVAKIVGAVSENDCHFVVLALVREMFHNNAVATCVLLDETPLTKANSFVFMHTNARCWCPMCMYVCSSYTEMLDPAPRLLIPRPFEMLLHTFLLDNDDQKDDDDDTVASDCDSGSSTGRALAGSAEMRRFLLPNNAAASESAHAVRLPFFDYIRASVLGVYAQTYARNGVLNSNKKAIDRFVAAKAKAGGAEAAAEAGAAWPNNDAMECGVGHDNGGGNSGNGSGLIDEDDKDEMRLLMYMGYERQVMRLVAVVLDVHDRESPNGPTRALAAYVQAYERRFDALCAHYCKPTTLHRWYRTISEGDTNFSDVISSLFDDEGDDDDIDGDRHDSGVAAAVTTAMVGGDGDDSEQGDVNGAYIGASHGRLNGHTSDGGQNKQQFKMKKKNKNKKEAVKPHLLRSREAYRRRQQAVQDEKEQVAAATAEQILREEEMRQAAERAAEEARLAAIAVEAEEEEERRRKKAERQAVRRKKKDARLQRQKKAALERQRKEEAAAAAAASVAAAAAHTRPPPPQMEAIKQLSSTKECTIDGVVAAGDNAGTGRAKNNDDDDEEDGDDSGGDGDDRDETQLVLDATHVASAANNDRAASDHESSEGGARHDNGALRCNSNSGSGRTVASAAAADANAAAAAATMSYWNPNPRRYHPCVVCNRRIAVDKCTFFVFECTLGCRNACICIYCYRKRMHKMPKSIVWIDDDDDASAIVDCRGAAKSTAAMQECFDRNCAGFTTLLAQIKHVPTMTATMTTTTTTTRTATEATGIIWYRHDAARCASCSRRRRHASVPPGSEDAVAEALALLPNPTCHRTVAASARACANPVTTTPTRTLPRLVPLATAMAAQETRNGEGNVRVAAATAAATAAADARMVAPSRIVWPPRVAQQSDAARSVARERWAFGGLDAFVRRVCAHLVSLGDDGDDGEATIVERVLKAIAIVQPGVFATRPPPPSSSFPTRSRVFRYIDARDVAHDTIVLAVVAHLSHCGYEGLPDLWTESVGVVHVGGGGRR